MAKLTKYDILNLQDKLKTKFKHQYKIIITYFLN